MVIFFSPGWNVAVPDCSLYEPGAQFMFSVIHLTVSASVAGPRRAIARSIEGSASETRNSTCVKATESRGSSTSAGASRATQILA